MRHTSNSRRPESGLEAQYRNNLPRHLLGLSRYVQSRLMHTLKDTLGHQQLRLNFEPYITLVGGKGIRLTELAEQLAISKQAANQTAKQIESAGYIQRVPDPADGRAKILQLTRRGHQLSAQGAELIQDIEQAFSAQLGKAAYSELSRHIGSLYTGLALSRHQLALHAVPGAPGFSGLLPRLADYITRELMQLTMARGHPALKMSFGQVLTLIGPTGGRIQQIARIQEVSKQAVSAIAVELEALGYIERTSDTDDARQVVLTFSKRGRQLQADSIAAVTVLENSFRSLLGESGLVELKAHAALLYHSLALEEEVFATSTQQQADLPALARRLKQQLGVQGARELARLITMNEEVAA